jgi:hypothetical protein
MEFFHFHNDHGEMAAFFAALSILPVARLWLKATWTAWMSLWTACPPDCPAKDVEHEHETAHAHETAGGK